MSKVTGRKVETIGNKWSDFIISRYQTNTQPYYVLTDLNEQKLNDPIGYMPDADDYLAWLKDGIGKFNN